MWTTSTPDEHDNGSLQNIAGRNTGRIDDGTIYIAASHVRAHQRTVAILSFKMMLFAEEKRSEKCILRLFDVYLDEHSNAVQSDIVFVSAAKLSIIDRYIHGVPDLIVEVLSQGNENHDRIRKKALYERFGVCEYWMIDALQKMLLAISLKKESIVKL